MLILHIEEELHDLDVDLEGLGGLVRPFVLRLVLGGLGLRGWRVGTLLSGQRQRNREEKGGEKDGGPDAVCNVLLAWAVLSGNFASLSCRG